MSKRLIELRDERNRLVTQAREVLKKAETEKRDLNADEQKQYDQLMVAQESKRTTILAEERQVELDREMADRDLRSSPPAGDPADPANQRTGPRGSPEYRAAFRSFITGSATPEELRALQAEAPTSGGYIVLPEQMVDALIKSIDDEVFIRRPATKFRVPNAASLGVPSLDADPADADWTSELDTGTEDSSMAFGKRELKPYPLAKRIKVSNKLLRSAMLNAEGLVKSRLAYKFGVSAEKAYLTGSGANQPLGLFTASADGIPTTRDVSTGNTTTAIQFDGLIEAKYSVKAGYWKGAEWIFHRDAVKQIAKLKDGEGQYIWQPAKTENDPDRLLGRPFNISEYAPNTFTTGLYVGLFGDLSYYWIADALDMQVQRLVELYAATNQTGFIGRQETDGMPVLGEAFARVKLA